ncbi:kinase-like domain-containing protein [Rhizophagus diaphanus]|nr:kinase-like domain-containing protein [Rhizophagus diaphanus] [Rhizophagus sp. MUCL 43196]
MSITEKKNKNFDYVDWISKAIEKNFIIYYDHTEFKNKKEIENNNNSVGKIFKANWNNTNTNLVVKSSYDSDVKKIINELKAHKEVDFHINILRIYGISKIENQYSLVLEYANGGSLYSYLKENFTNLEWDDKYCLALQLAGAIDFIHNKGIIHCNLHEQNVLIHKNNIKVADFGLSKRVNETSNYSNKAFDFLPYLDPTNLNVTYNTSQPRIMNFKSDIYSIGILLWLLSSGRRPFYDEGTKYDINLAMDIINGKREEIIKGTPVEYSDIYTACWSDDPDERPSLQIVISCLQSIIDHSIKSITNEIEKESLNNDFDSMMDNDLSLNDDNPSNLVTNNFTDLNNDVEKNVDKIIDYVIKLHDEFGYTITETEEIIRQLFESISKPIQIKIFDWIIKNQTSSKYIFFYGFLYFNGIIVKRNEDKAYGLLLKASKDNYPIAQVYFGKLYKDPKKSFYWYQKSAENGNRLALLYLGNCYENGEGIDQNLEKKAIFSYKKVANNENKKVQYDLGYFNQNREGIEQNLEKIIYQYKEAAKNGNKIAQFKLGYFYQNGKGVQRDINKAIEWYERSAKQGFSYAQNRLGYIYENEEEIDQDLEKSIYWYTRAAKGGCRIAQSNLGYFYEKGKGTQKDIKKAIEWYKRSAEQEYGNAQCSLGYLYEKGEEIDQDLEKAIYWYKKATENGYEAAHYYLGKCYQYGIGIEKDEVKAFEHYKKSAEKGYLGGKYILGYCYENGIGTNIDKENAVELYKDAAEGGNEDAKIMLELQSSYDSLKKNHPMAESQDFLIPICCSIFLLCIFCKIILYILNCIFKVFSK